MSKNYANTIPFMDDTYVRFANEMIDKAPMPNEWIDNTNRQLIEAALKTVQNPSKPKKESTITNLDFKSMGFLLLLGDCACAIVLSPLVVGHVCNVSCILCHGRNTVCNSAGKN